MADNEANGVSGGSSSGPIVSPLGIRILFRHPTIDPAVITTGFGVQPNSQARVGDVVTTRNGTKLSGTYADTAWVMWKDYYGEPHIDASVADFLRVFTPHAEFLRQLSSECYAALIISFPGQFYFGGEISPEQLRTIADLGLTLGIEVFPDSAT